MPHVWWQTGPSPAPTALQVLLTRDRVLSPWAASDAQTGGEQGSESLSLSGGAHGPVCSTRKLRLHPTPTPTQHTHREPPVSSPQVPGRGTEPHVQYKSQWLEGVPVGLF